MNARELRILMAYMPYIQFEGKSWELAGDLADRLHDKSSPYVVTTDHRHVMALIHYQAMQLNGEWDQQALDEVIDWIRFRVLIADIDWVAGEVQRLKDEQKPRSKKPVREIQPYEVPVYEDARFSEID